MALGVITANVACSSIGFEVFVSVLSAVGLMIAVPLLYEWRVRARGYRRWVVEPTTDPWTKEYYNKRYGTAYDTHTK